VDCAGAKAYFPVTIDVLVLAAFGGVFMAAAHGLHRRTRDRLA
jgi:hypothetical protein